MSEKLDLKLLDNAKKIEVDYNEKLLEKIKILEKENKKLKKENKILSHNSTNVVLTDTKVMKRNLELQQENEKLQEEKRYYKDKYLDLYNSYQNCEDLKRKNAIEILKFYFNFNFNDKNLGLQIISKISCVGKGTSNCIQAVENYSILKEVFGDENIEH